MARHDDEREADDTTVIAGGNEAWSAVDRPDEGRESGAVDPSGAAVDSTEDLQGSSERLAGSDDPTALVPAVRDPDGGPLASPDSTTDTEGVNGAPGIDRDVIGEIGGSEGGAPIIPPGPPAPVLVAAGLGLLTKSGWVFKDVELTLRPATVAAIVGPSGTGRSCLLLALSGRMDPNTGTLTVAGHSFADEPGHIRALTAVARIGSVAGPEPGLTVRESIDERCLLEDVATTIGRARFDEACAALELTLEPTVLVATLMGDQATLFAVALACVRVSAVIVLDDLDRGVSAAVQQSMLAALIRLARTGPTVIVSTTDRIPVMEADVVLDLTPKDGQMVWHFEPAAAHRGAVLRQLDPYSDARQWAAPQLGPGPLTPRTPPEPVDQAYLDQIDDLPTEDPR